MSVVLTKYSMSLILEMRYFENLAMLFFKLNFKDAMFSECQVLIPPAQNIKQICKTESWWIPLGAV